MYANWDIDQLADTMRAGWRAKGESFAALRELKPLRKAGVIGGGGNRTRARFPWSADKRSALDNSSAPPTALDQADDPQPRLHELRGFDARQPSLVPQRGSGRQPPVRISPR